MICHCQSLVYSRVPTEVQGIENCPIKKKQQFSILQILYVVSSHYGHPIYTHYFQAMQDFFHQQWHVCEKRPTTKGPYMDTYKEKSLVPHLLLLVHRVLPTLLPCAPHQKGTTKSSNWRWGILAKNLSQEMGIYPNVGDEKWEAIVEKGSTPTHVPQPFLPYLVCTNPKYVVFNYFTTYIKKLY